MTTEADKYIPSLGKFWIWLYIFVLLQEMVACHSPSDEQSVISTRHWENTSYLLEEGDSFQIDDTWFRFVGELCTLGFTLNLSLNTHLSW